MKKYNEKHSNGWLVILHNSFNLTGIVILTTILAENSIDDSFWTMFPLIMFFAYGALSGLMHREESKYILFRKSFWIVLLVTIEAFILLGISSVEKENVDFQEYLSIAMRGTYSLFPLIASIFFGPFILGYIIAIISKSLKNLIKKI